MRTDLLYNCANNDIVIEDAAPSNVYIASWGNTGAAQFNRLNVSIRKPSSLQEGIYVKVPYLASTKKVVVSVELDGQSSSHDLYTVDAMGIEDGRIRCSQLCALSLDVFFFRLDSHGKLIVYSGVNSDFVVGEAKKQNEVFLLYCKPGNSYRYPTTGVHIQKFVNGHGSAAQFAQSIKNEFASDGMSLLDLQFDANTNHLALQTQETS